MLILCKLSTISSGGYYFFYMRWPTINKKYFRWLLNMKKKHFKLVRFFQMHCLATNYFLILFPLRIFSEVTWDRLFLTFEERDLVTLFLLGEIDLTNVLLADFDFLNFGDFLRKNIITTLACFVTSFPYQNDWHVFSKFLKLLKSQIKQLCDFSFEWIDSRYFYNSLFWE